MTGRSGAGGRLFRFGWEQRLRDDPTASGLTQEVLFVMASFADPDGTLRLSEERLATCIDKSVRVARRGIAAAQASGYVERLTRGHHVPGKAPAASRYRLTVPPAACEARDGEDDPDDVGARADAGCLPDGSDRLRVVGAADDDPGLTG